MKKAIAVFVTLVLLISSVATVFAAEGMTFVLGKTRFSAENEIKTLTVEAENLENISVIQFTVVYDSTKFELQNVSDGSDGSYAGTVEDAAKNGIISDATVSSIEPGKVNLVWESQIPVSGDGVLVELQFKALSDDAGLLKLGFSSDEEDFFTVRQGDVDDEFTFDAEVEIVEGIISGDVNNDEEIDIIDLQRLYAHLNGSNVIPDGDVAHADINEDGEVDIIDLQRLYAHLNGSNLLD